MSERVDLDRLADFVGGALDGTPDADAVRRLISTEPEWATAHAELVAADAAVRRDLTRLAAQPARMPAEVTTRLIAALRTPDAAQDHDGPPPAPVRDELAARRGRTTTARKRRARWMAGLSAAAAVAAVAMGLTVFLPQLADSRKAEHPTVSAARDDAGAGNAPAAPGAGGPEVTAAGPPTMASGRNYTPQTLSELGAAAPAGAPGQPGTAADRALSATESKSASVPAELARLATPAGRAACLEAIRAKFGGVVNALDYARFSDRPALIVLLSDTRTGGTGRLVVVAGPDCGSSPRLVDERYSGPVG